MIQYICGNIDTIKSKYNLGTYVDDIVEYVNKPIPLFGEIDNSAVYFLYNAKLFKDKADILTLESKCVYKEVYCIIEAIDKKSSFYKHIKNTMIDFSKKELSIKDKADLFFKDITIINEVSDSEMVSFLYALYYNFKNRKYKAISGKLINMVLCGKVTTKHIKKIFLYTITR